MPPSYSGPQILKGLLAKNNVSNFLLSMPATLVLKCHEHLSVEIFSFLTDRTDVVSTHRHSQVSQKTTRYVYEAVFKQNKSWGNILLLVYRLEPALVQLPYRQ